MSLLSFETDVTQNILQTNSKLETSTLSIARVITPKGIKKGGGCPSMVHKFFLVYGKKSL